MVSLTLCLVGFVRGDKEILESGRHTQHSVRTQTVVVSLRPYRIVGVVFPESSYREEQFETSGESPKHSTPNVVKGNSFTIRLCIYVICCSSESGSLIFPCLQILTSPILFLHDVPFFTLVLRGEKRTKTERRSGRAPHTTLDGRFHRHHVPVPDPRRRRRSRVFWVSSQGRFRISSSFVSGIVLSFTTWGERTPSSQVYEGSSSV